MLSTFYEGEDYDNQAKSKMADWFLDSYKKIQAGDLYRWVWEGEFGLYNKAVDLSLDRLTEDIRLARIKHGRTQKSVWEPLGLAFSLIKINLVPYADSGCPLKRLLMLEERARDVRPNPLRFKHDWHLMKTQITPGLSVSLDSISEFENSIPFHVTPEVSYSEGFLEEYGLGYRIVPRALFFNYFPEYEFEAKEM